MKGLFVFKGQALNFHRRTGWEIIVLVCVWVMFHAPADAGVGSAPPNSPAAALKKAASYNAINGATPNQTQGDPSLRALALVLSSFSTDLSLAGTPGWTYRVQYTANLASTNWETLGTATVDGQGAAVFNDRRERIQPAQFYRLSKREFARATVSMLSALLLPEGAPAVSQVMTNVALSVNKEVTQ